ncbi:MAG: hypothetical protein LBD07_06055 [Spirochaetaceae bacterium]|jgi:hypothetical protein|nr:hypothetical protein [Spirochaetaceae bacterium]
MIVFIAKIYANGSSAPEDNVSSGDNFIAQMLYSGFWENNDSFKNRINAILFMPLKFSFRAQFLDRRLISPQDDWNAGLTELALGLYHQNTGTRALYGKLETWGLAARTRNIWLHSPAWFEAHTISNADLKTEISVNSNEVLYFNWRTPELLSLFNVKSIKNFDITTNISTTFSNDDTIFIEGGANLRYKERYKLHFEWLYCEKNLPARHQTGWFSDKPYLPPRDMNFYAYSFVYSMPFLGISADIACSDVFGFGKDIYFNGGIRAGSKPWRFSFTADSAGSRYTGSNGYIPGAGFRTAGKIEWFGRKNAQILLETILRSGRIMSPFDRSFSKIKYHFPVKRGVLVALSRISLEFERNAVSPEKIKDSVTSSIGFTTGSARSVIRCSLTENTMEKPYGISIPYPHIVCEHKFDQFKMTFEISYPVSFVTLKSAVSCHVLAGKQTNWDKSISASAYGVLGRLTVKLFNNEKNGAFDYSVSWRLEKKI